MLTSNDAPSPPSQARPRAAPSLRLGEWRFAPERHQIERGGKTVRLEPKPASLLLLLAENAGRVVSKEEIVDSVWDGRFIADSAVTRTMAELRRALGDDAHHPRFIETIPKRGYRLLVPTAPEAGEPGSGAAVTAAPRRRRRLLMIAAACVLTFGGGIAAWQRFTPHDLPAERREVMIAVLPLENLSRDPEEDYFANGMTEALITSLARIDSVGVISRRSVEAFRERDQPLAEIARTLGVGAVVEGSVLKADGRVRVTVQLTDVEDDAHLWAQSYERELSGVLALQSEIALAIVQEIRVALSPHSAVLSTGGRQVDPKTYEHYLRGREALERCDREGPNAAAEHFQAALAIDPTYAPALAGLAIYYTKLAFFGHLSPEIALPPARFAAEKALELDDSVAEAYLASAFVRYSFDWDWAGAEREFRRALELAPNSAAAHKKYAFFLTCQARFDEAVARARRAVELDPLAVSSRNILGWVYLNAGRYEESLMALGKIRELRLATEEHPYVSWNYGLLGEYDTALAKIRQRPSDNPLFLGVQGWILGRAGRLEEAREVRREIERRASETDVDPYALAIVNAGLGDVDLALDALEAGYAIRSPNMIFLKVEQFFGPLRSAPRYRELLRKLDLGKPAA